MIEEIAKESSRDQVLFIGYLGSFIPLGRGYSTACTHLVLLVN